MESSWEFGYLLLLKLMQNKNAAVEMYFQVALMCFEIESLEYALNWEDYILSFLLRWLHKQEEVYSK